jgi:hypothetical protein
MSSSYVSLIVTHSDIPNFRVEKNFDLSITIADLKKRVRSHLPAFYIYKIFINVIICS